MKVFLALLIMLTTISVSSHATENCETVSKKIISVRIISKISNVDSVMPIYKNTEDKIYAEVEKLGWKKEDIILESKMMSVDRGYYSDVENVEVYDLDTSYTLKINNSQLGLKLVKALSAQKIGAQLSIEEINECEKED